MLSIIALCVPMPADRETLWTGGAKLLMFTVSNCTYCDDATPVFQEAATKLQNQTAQLQFEYQLPYIERVTSQYVDCIANGDMCRDFNITGYPSFVLLQDNHSYLFPSNISASHLMRWTLAMLQRCLVPIESEAELSDAMPRLNLSSYFIVHSPRQLDYESVFAEFKGRVLAGWLKSEETSISVNYDGMYHAPSDLSAASVRRFILQFKNKRWQLLTKSVFRELSDEREMAILAMVPEDSDSLLGDVRRALSQQNPRDLSFNFGFLDATRAESAPFLQQFNLSQSDLPAAIYMDYINQRHRVFARVQNANDFVSQALLLQYDPLLWERIAEKESDGIAQNILAKIGAIVRQKPLQSCLVCVGLITIAMVICRRGQRHAPAKSD